MIFLRVLPKFFLCPHYSGVSGALGPRFIEPPSNPGQRSLKVIESGTVR